MGLSPRRQTVSWLRSSLKSLLRCIRQAVDGVVLTVAAIVTAVVSLVTPSFIQPRGGHHLHVMHCVAADICAFNLGRHDHLGPDHGHLVLSVLWLHAAQDWWTLGKKRSIALIPIHQ